MSKRADQPVVAAEPISKLLEALLDEAAFVFVKKLSTNDLGWSWELGLTSLGKTGSRYPRRHIGAVPLKSQTVGDRAELRKFQRFCPFSEKN